MAKKLFELTIEDLKQIHETNEWPAEGVSFEGVGTSTEVESIIRHRNSPAKVSKILLLAKGIAINGSSVDNERKITYQGVGRKESIQRPYSPTISTEVREKRLKLKEEELALKREKAKSTTLILEELVQLKRGQKQIIHTQERIEKVLKGVISLLLKKGGKGKDGNIKLES